MFLSFKSSEKSSSYISKRKKPINFSELNDALYSHELTKEINGFHRFHFYYCLILNGIIVRLPFVKFETYLSSYREFNFFDKLKLFVYLKNPGPIAENCIWITDNWTNNYFHWMCDALPRLLESNNKETPIKVILPEHYLKHSYVTETLNLLDFKVFPINRNSANLVKNLYVCEHVAPSGNYNKQIMLNLREKLRYKTDTFPSKRLYISREKASHRKIENECELLPILKKYNFDIIHFEDFTWNEQRKLLSEYEVIISIHGAGLTNMLLLPNASKAIEIRNKSNSSDNCFFTLASELDIDFYILTANPVTTESKSTPFDSINLNLDPNKLEAFLKKYFP